MSKLDIKLSKRKEDEAYRSLIDHSHLVDFSSNNYLGLDRFESFEIEQNKAAERTGSRLLTGNSNLKEDVESKIAGFYNSGSALIYGSGYMANLGLFSCLAQRDEYYVFDELCHASIRDGMRLSNANAIKFKHNDLDDLKKILQKISGKVYVIIEGIYSMDGDAAKLQDIVALKQEFDFDIIIDEAHSNGVINKLGKGYVEELHLEESIFARVITFGKALGLHGAVVLGNRQLKEFQVNFSRPFIYTTAPSEHFFNMILKRFNTLNSHLDEIAKLHHNCDYLKELAHQNKINLIGGDGAIFMIMKAGNKEAKALAQNFQNEGLDVRPILSPTVKAGAERLRICMHAYNTKEEIDTLIKIAKHGI